MYECKHNEENTMCLTHNINLRKSKYHGKYCPKGMAMQTAPSRS